MKLQAQLSQRLEQRQVLTQQMIQNMELLQVPLMELSQLVMQELEQNPTLELKADVEEPEEAAADKEKTEKEKTDEEERLELIDQIDRDREFNRAVARTGGEADDDPEREEYMINQAPIAVSLQQHLVSQLHLAEVADDLRQAAEFVISHIDGRGYLLFRAEDVATVLAPTYSSVQYDDLLGLVRDTPEKYAPEALSRILARANPDQTPEALLERVRGNLRQATLEALAVQLSPLLTGRPLEELVKLVTDAVALVQTFEPKGVGAFDTVECFMLQLDANDPDLAKKKYLIDRHLDDITHNRRPKIADDLRQAEAARALFGFAPETPADRVIEEINRLVTGVSALNPRPGATFSAEPNPAVVPDIIVKEVDGEYEITLEESFLPAVGINQSYAEMLKARKVGKDERQYIRGKIEAARRILSAIEHRRYTMQRISERVMTHQKDFFDKGPEGLKPLTMTQLADEVGVVVSTVSRAVQGKYVQTPRGIFSLRSFFPQAAPGTPGATAGGWVTTPVVQNGDMTRDQVIDRIREIVSGEDRKNPLSDKEIGDRLEKMLNLKLKRRTVAKYREEAGIQSSRLRREF